MPARVALCVLPLLAWLVACGAGDSPPEPGAGAAPSPTAAEEPAAAPGAAGPPAPAGLARGLVLALAQFERGSEKPVPGAARLEFLVAREGRWQVVPLEDPESNVFHKAMLYDGGDGPSLLTLGGTAAIVKRWRMQDGRLVPSVVWKQDFGGKFSRMRDAEAGDLYGDGRAAIAVATHDQGVVAVLRPEDGGAFRAEELDREADTFVHEVEIGDLDGDGVLEVYATPSEPNKLDGSPQPGKVVRYVPARGEGRTVVADLGDRHAKEILIADVDGDGRDELYVSVEGHVSESKELVHPVEVRRYDAGTDAAAGRVVTVIDDRLTRFLTVGDVEGDGRREMVAASFSKGLWLLRPEADPAVPWRSELIDADSAGFEHASILTDLDGDGRDELYVASDRHKEVRRYVWNGKAFDREVIYVRPDDRAIFTWNLMPVPVALIPAR